MLRSENHLSHERFSDVLECDAALGLLTWKVGRRKGLYAGTHKADGYVIVRVDGVNYRAHRLIWFYHHKVWPLGDIDHINGDRGDNRLANLREASRSQNIANSKLRITNTSGFKGVHWCKVKEKWASRIGFTIGTKRKNKHLGYFENREEAHKAYIVAAKNEFGEFARAR